MEKCQGVHDEVPTSSNTLCGAPGVRSSFARKMASLSVEGVPVPCSVSATGPVSRCPRIWYFAGLQILGLRGPGRTKPAVLASEFSRSLEVALYSGGNLENKEQTQTTTKNPLGTYTLSFQQRTSGLMKSPAASSTVSMSLGGRPTLDPLRGNPPSVLLHVPPALHYWVYEYDC